MASYQIITDSCCDFRPEKYTELGLTAQPLMLTYRGHTRPDRSDDSIRALYAGLRAGEAASTAAVNTEGWAALIRGALDAGQDVLVMAFSSGLSTTYQSAVIAARELAESYPARKILVCDTLSASLGQGLLVYLCAREKEAGKTLEEVHAFAEETKGRVCHWFTVDDLNHLKRGGRISAATALFGTMLSIKPVMHVDDTGHLTAVSKARGRKASLLALVDEMEKTAIDPRHQTVFISHGDCEADARFVAEEITRRFGVTDIHINYVGPVIGNHSGPGTMALFFLGTQR